MKKLIISNKLKITAVILSLLLLVGIFVIPKIIPKAETDGKLVVHFYSSEGIYNWDNLGGQSDVRWGVYYWMQRSNIVESSGTDSSYINENKQGDSAGQTFDVTLTANEVTLLKGGKPLGLIMVRVYTADGRIKPHWDYKDINIDRKIDVNFDENNEYHIWLIAGDKTTYLSLDAAKTAFERIESVRFNDYNTVDIQTTKKISASTSTEPTTVSVTKTSYVDGELVSELLAENITFEPSSIKTASDNVARIGQIKLPKSNFSGDTFETDATYTFDVSGYAYPKTADKTRLFLSDEFNLRYIPPKTDAGGNDYEMGAIYTKAETTFRVWAPVATTVILKLYTSGDPTDPTMYDAPVYMEKVGYGVWEYTMLGDLHGIYYTYTIDNDGDVSETIDVNAKSAGINGDRGMVVNFNEVNPDLWDEDELKSIAMREKQYAEPDPIIWEIHVRDFSIHPDSGMKYKGKYLAFTEQDTTLKGSDTIKTGLNYLKDLGINYIHLQPVYDFDKVDESRMGDPTYTGKFNWGYDPKNYNIPEGSYSTDAYSGEVRVNEFKQMVKSLHDAGIGVIMDVVYNHTFNIESPLNKTVPLYYYRQINRKETSSEYNPIGSFNYPEFRVDNMGNYLYGNGSGCDSEMASEREMYRRYMTDSVVYWANEYHIDGFRFDLMGLHDILTMKTIRDTVDVKVKGGKGVLIYGEPWGALEHNIYSTTPDLYPMTAANAEYIGNRRIGMFNDSMRNAVRGDNSTDPVTEELNGDKGYVNNGNILGSVGVIKTAVQGKLNGGNTNVMQSVSYAAAHDNFTLWDQIVCSVEPSFKTPTVYETGNNNLKARHKLASSIVLLSRGYSFMLAGDEMARTKYGNHNSFEAQDKVNAFDYRRAHEMSDIYNHYKALIEIKKRFKGLQVAVTNDDTAFYEFYTTGTTNTALSEGVIGYSVRGMGESETHYYDMAVIFNPLGVEKQMTLQLFESVGATSWHVLCDENGTYLNGSQREIIDRTPTVTVAPYSTLVLVNKK